MDELTKSWLRKNGLPRAALSLSRDKYQGLVAFVMDRSEPSMDETPDIISATFLPDTMPKRPVTEKYAKDGGSEWPDRWLFQLSVV